MTTVIDTGRARDGAYERYTGVAIALHWLIALMILAQLGVGFLLIAGVAEADEDARLMIYEAIQTHKAVGLTILALSVLRLVWRFWRPAPPLPAGSPGWQRALSGLSHVGLYILMIGIPLTGWAMVSTSPAFSALPTSYFGLFDVPHLPLVTLLGENARAGAAALFKDAHFALALGMVGLLGLHVAAALKHHFVDRDPILARISPGMSAPDGPLAAPSQRSGAGGWLAGLVVLAAGAGGTAALVATAPGDPAASAEDAMAEEVASAMPDASEAPLWSVDPAASALSFGGSYVMGQYQATFENWSATIAFDPDNLAGSAIRAVVDVTSARSGSAQTDGAMQNAEYFAAAEHPTAVFEATEIRAGEGPGAYVADGTLSLRGVEAPLSLPFSLEIDGDRATAAATIEIQRLDFGVGPAVGGDAGVAPGVTIEIEIEAARAAGDG